MIYGMTLYENKHDRVKVPELIALRPFHLYPQSFRNPQKERNMLLQSWLPGLRYIIQLDKYLLTLLTLSLTCNIGHVFANIVVLSVFYSGTLEYQAQSPDENALVSAARNFGFVFRVSHRGGCIQTFDRSSCPSILQSSILRPP